MQLSPYLKLLRPTQWLKNLMLLFPPFLGGAILNSGLLINSIMPVSAFCLASSATYIFNDLTDIPTDRLHPLKKSRPLAAGLIKPSTASSIAVALLLVSFALALLTSKLLFLYLLLYLAVANGYSLYFKNVAVLDLFCISAGFIIRLMAGGAVFSVQVSEWLFLSVLLLSLFLSTGKRLGEKNLLGIHLQGQRKVLVTYPEGFLDGILVFTGSSVLVTYAMYAVSKHSPLLLATVPLCCFGLMRYILRVKSGSGGDPTESLTRDLSLLVTGLLWALMIGWGIYGG